MSPEKKSNREWQPKVAYQIAILSLLLGFAAHQFPKVVELFFRPTINSKPYEPPFIPQNIEQFPPGFLKDEVIELKLQNIGQYAAVNRIANVPSDQIKMKDRQLVKIRKIYTRQTIKGFFQFFEGAEIVANLDGSFYLGESRVYIASQILYILDRDDSEKINK